MTPCCGAAGELQTGPWDSKDLMNHAAFSERAPAYRPGRPTQFERRKVINARRRTSTNQRS